ncbi:threonine--tRNA ligase [PVC group bacterium (ex Bugula neritina AB1)]|nr:threonine--tRNA ligase [PVC group bacterium (ex Bugula neritina AB1)]
MANKEALEDKMTPLERMRHSLAHVMAIAVKELYPETKVGIGPPIENGFYYDFDREDSFTQKDLQKIEKRMKRIIARNDAFERKEVLASEAIDMFKAQGEKYKVEIIERLVSEKGVDNVSLYYTGDFVDLCRGPHVASSKELGVFKLTRIAGAYWLGDEKREMLQRIYALAFETQAELEEHLKMLEEADKRDHRKLGKSLKLFTTDESIGAGLILYQPNGMILRRAIEQFEREEHIKRDYQEVLGPGILNTKVWKTSGHYQMGYPMYFFEIDRQEYGIKPMNCPAHLYLFKTEIRSYKDLPLRFFELGTVYRYEKSGVLHGLLRARTFTQDDAHIFCLPSQLKSEIIDVILFVQDVFKTFGFEKFEVELSTRPEKSIGDDETWDHATKSLEEALKELDVAYEINSGDGAFYGPKIDIKLRDALNRVWQCATIQCDFALPERFEVSYIDSNGKKCRPVMLHRAILGSLERFMGILIEHYAGAFPVWLAPVQVNILPIADRHHEYAQKLVRDLKRKGLRVHFDKRNEKIGFKLRESRENRVPYAWIVGDKEVSGDTVSIWQRGVGDRGALSSEEAVQEVLDAHLSKAIW